MFKTQNKIEVYFDKVNLSQEALDREVYAILDENSSLIADLDRDEFEQLLDHINQNKQLDFLTKTGEFIASHLRRKNTTIEWDLEGDFNSEIGIEFYTDDLQGTHDRIYSAVRETKFDSIRDIRRIEGKLLPISKLPAVMLIKLIAVAAILLIRILGWVALLYRRLKTRTS